MTDPDRPSPVPSGEPMTGSPPAHDPIRVVLVDDEHLVCAFLTTILGTADDLVVVGEAYDGRGGVELVRREQPDVVLMDLRMPGGGGVAAIEELHRLLPQVAVVALTTFEDDETVRDALAAGAAGFLLKTTPPGDLVDLVRLAANGHRVLAAEALDRLVARAERARPGDPPRRVRLALESLTSREREVLAGIADGASNAEIAATLYLSEATVKGHVSRILAKLGCDNRTQAGLIAARYG